jgi:hypothetical protein
MHFGQWIKNNTGEAELRTFINQSTNWPTSSDDLNDYVSVIQTVNPANKDALLIALSRNFERWSRQQPNVGDSFGEKYGTLLLAVFGLIMAIVLVFGLFNERFFRSIAEAGQARGLITFLFAFATIAIILLITVATFWMEKDEVEARFTKAKDLVAILIGVLGTILGFYFGSASAPGTVGRTMTVSDVALSAFTAKAGDKVTLSANIRDGSPPYQYEIKANDPTGAIKTDLKEKKSDTGSISEEIPIPPDLSKAETVTFTISAQDAKGIRAQTTSNTLSVQPK